MRRLRITVALAAVACVVGALASPAFAKEKSLLRRISRERAHGAGRSRRARPWSRRRRKANSMRCSWGQGTNPLFKFACEKLSVGRQSIRRTQQDLQDGNQIQEVQGGAPSRRQTSSKANRTSRTAQGAHRRNATTRLPESKDRSGLEMEFHSNGVAGLGKDEEQRRQNHQRHVRSEITVKGGLCHLVILPQTVPKKAKTETKEVEAVQHGEEQEQEDKITLPQRVQGTDRNRLGTAQNADLNPGRKIRSLPIQKRTRREIQRRNELVVEPSIFEGELEEIKIKKGKFFVRNRQERKEKEKGICAQRTRAVS